MERRLLPLNDLVLGLRTLASNAGATFDVPSVGIDKTKDKTTIHLGLPGVSPEEVNVEVDNYTVTISVEKNEEAEGAKWFSGFKQAFSVPKDVDTAKVTAELKDGLLTLVLPVSEEKQSRKIEVKH